jgi:hypothetical protein
MSGWCPALLSDSRRGSSSAPPMPIVVGSPRSGTTLLRLMLDAHPDLAIPPETGFLIAGRELRSRGDGLPERFAETITTYPPGAPAWADFGIPEAEFRERLDALRPFTVRDGFRLFYRMYAAPRGPFHPRDPRRA